MYSFDRTSLFTLDARSLSSVVSIRCQSQISLRSRVVAAKAICKSDSNGTVSAPAVEALAVPGSGESPRQPGLMQLSVVDLDLTCAGRWRFWAHRTFSSWSDGCLSRIWVTNLSRIIGQCAHSCVRYPPRLALRPCRSPIKRGEVPDRRAPRVSPHTSRPRRSRRGRQSQAARSRIGHTRLRCRRQTASVIRSREVHQIGAAQRHDSRRVRKTRVRRHR